MSDFLDGITPQPPGGARDEIEELRCGLATMTEQFRLAINDIDSLRAQLDAAKSEVREPPRGWRIESLEPASFLTDEANAARKWVVSRLAPPYCTEKGMNAWFGATLAEALASARADLKLPEDDGRPL